MKNLSAILMICFQLGTAVALRAQATPPSPAAGQPKTQAAPEEPLPVLAVPPGYRYEVRGRRDPFVNPIPPPPPAPAVPAKPARPAGLKGIDIAELTVLGVYISKDDPAMTRVILQVPGMRAPVIASRGDAFFDGAIKEIRQDSVIFTMMDPGNKPRNPSEEKVKPLHSTAGDKK
jgi:hypothetical protein